MENERKIQPLTEISNDLRDKILSTLRQGEKTSQSIKEQITNIELALVEIYEEVLNG